MACKPNKPSTNFIRQALQEPNSATKFDTGHENIPDGCRYGGMQRSFTYWYKSLWAYNEGWNGNWRDERKVTQNAKKDMVEAVAFQLDLASLRKKKVVRFARRLDGRICNGNGGLHMLTMCLCQIVLKEDERCSRYYHPLSKPEKNDPRFTKLVDEFDLDPQKMANSIQSIRSNLGLSY